MHQTKSKGINSFTLIVCAHRVVLYGFSYLQKGDHFLLIYILNGEQLFQPNPFSEDNGQKKGFY